MADVKRGDVVFITSGDYAGAQFRVADSDVKSGFARVTRTSWLTSLATIKRPAEAADDVNLDGQTAEGLITVAADVACDVQMPAAGRGGETESGWGQRPDQVRRILFDDRTVVGKRVDEPALEA